MMKIEHIALWVKDLERMRAFYERFFNGRSNEKYVNSAKGFASYFVSFEGGARLELMQRLDVTERPVGERLGYAHLAMSVGSKTAVDALTERLQQAGYTIAGEPRTTGDGYYESVVLDPEGNAVEITD